MASPGAILRRKTGFAFTTAIEGNIKSVTYADTLTLRSLTSFEMILVS
jgi:hypothetical protein